jgi:hypothetical protein
MSDLGNEIGLCVSKYYENMNENEIELFVQGFKHGARIPKKID